MDKEIPIIEQNRRKKKVFVYAVFAVMLVVALVWWLRSTLDNSVKTSEIRIAIAEKGDVENTLTAVGEVQPAFEQIITSPITAVVKEVYLEAGATVKTGDKIVELDKEFTTIEVEKQKNQLDLKRNGITKLRWELEKSFFDLQINDSVKALKINSLKAELENAKRLHKAGGGTREAIEQADLNLRVAQLEKKQLENDIRIKQQTMRSDLRESELQAQIQEKDLQEQTRKLQQADIIASRNGVLTFVNKNLGSKVSEGDVLVKLADLGSFKIMGSISDNYAAQIKVGMPVIVRINEQAIRGMLVNIRPAVQNNTLQFDIALDKQFSALLRPNQKVEVYPVTDQHLQIVRIANGSAFKGALVQDVFVLRPDGKAERRKIKIGLSNFDFVEITEGIQVGEKVIITDLSKYKNVQELSIQP
ncbi:MAG: HlyD family efflux transporter periplasmic adaptor subunit [Spirosomataceae bacterium]